MFPAGEVELTDGKCGFTDLFSVLCAPPRAPWKLIHSPGEILRVEPLPTVFLQADKSTGPGQLH